MSWFKAAEKRFRDEKSCASGADAQREADKAAKESVASKVIDLTLDDDSDIKMAKPDSDSDSEVIIVKDVHPRPTKPPNSTPGPSKKNISKVPNVDKTSSSKSSTTGTGRLVPTVSAKSKSPRSSVATNWSCSVCTLINPASALQCDACATHKPFDESEGWSCLTCGENGNSHDHWACKFCGTIKVHS